MTPEFKATFSQNETAIHTLANAVQAQNEQLRVLNERLDQIVVLLTPKESDETGLSDILAHLVQIGREQLTLAQNTLHILDGIENRLPPLAEDQNHTPAATNGSRQP